MPVELGPPVGFRPPGLHDQAVAGQGQLPGNPVIIDARVGNPDHSLGQPGRTGDRGPRDGPLDARVSLDQASHLLDARDLEQRGRPVEREAS